LYFDCACAILSRQFDRDRDRVLARTKQEKVGGIVAWFSDVEKQQSLLDVCKANSGQCYAAVGINPDNIDRTNKKMHASWLSKIEELCLSGECVAIVSGLNLSREVGTHFAQESVLKSCCELSLLHRLPLILHVSADGPSLDKLLEILLEHGWGGG
jgi:Tat protein secretion system quality control protein TatD with DNase activity